MISMLNEIYEQTEGSEASLAYSARHGIASAAALTVTDDEIAELLTLHLAPRIKGKTVVEIGGGIGLLACHMGHIAKRVFCIEANPMWSAAFTWALIEGKPKNVSFLFGAADEFLPMIQGDVAVFCTHSGVKDMTQVAALFAPTVIDVYGEMIAENPEAFDKLAQTLRLHA